MYRSIPSSATLLYMLQIPGYWYPGCELAFTWPPISMKIDGCEIESLCDNSGHCTLVHLLPLISSCPCYIMPQFELEDISLSLLLFSSCIVAWIALEGPKKQRKTRKVSDSSKAEVLAQRKRYFSSSLSVSYENSNPLMIMKVRKC